jgi:predicted HicB family RNase H-like nuclease
MESFAFTEVDRAGVAVSINALSAPHREYLASGKSLNQWATQVIQSVVNAGG